MNALEKNALISQDSNRVIFITIIRQYFYGVFRQDTTEHQLHTVIELLAYKCSENLPGEQSFLAGAADIQTLVLSFVRNFMETAGCCPRTSELISYSTAVTAFASGIFRISFSEISEKFASYRPVVDDFSFFLIQPKQKV